VDDASVDIIRAVRAGEVAPIYRRSSLRLRDVTKDARDYAARMLPAGGIKRFCIVTTMRTGSELLVDLLDSHEKISCEGEIMWSRPVFPLTFVRGRVRRARFRRNEAYGFKIVSTHLINFMSGPDRGFAHRLADEGFVFVHLRRRNVVRQVLSHLRARESGEWHPRDDADAAATTVSIDPLRMIAQARLIEIHDEGLGWMLEGLPTRELWYEDHLRDAATQQSTVDGICEMLGIQSRPVRTSLSRIARPKLEDEIDNLDEIRRVISGTRYADLLD
jgi:LPS sulfotransferase NodH